LVPSYVFYNEKDAIEWAKKVSFPKVFKLRSGAGSQHVRLVRSYSDSKRLIRKAFGKGFSQYDGWSNLKERIRKYRNGKTSLHDVIKGIIRLGYPTRFSKMSGREKGYVYFQDFIPDNDSDIRVVVVDNKAFAIKRMTRENDFRASGSGTIHYDKELFTEEIIRRSLKLAEKLNSQCIAFDFVYSKETPLLVEISYGFTPEGYDPCPGYWDEELNWHEGYFNPYGWMVESVLKAVKNSDE
jgi:glutathione synthase/RimK-type ligase-like ATP-grasp enzyme